MDDLGQASERRIAGQPFLDQPLERAASLIVAVRVGWRRARQKPTAPSSRCTCSTSFGSTNMILASGSRKRRMSQAVAARFTWILLRVTHFTTEFG